MTKISIIGTVGVPAKYGGFETLAENLVEYNDDSSILYQVYCSKRKYSTRLANYKGAALIYVPLKANGYQSILYDYCSIIHALRTSDILLILGVSGCTILPFIRFFSSKKIIVNIDGLEHRRSKWSRFVRYFLKVSETFAVKYANLTIADNKGIQDYVWSEYNRKAALIKYGGDQVLKTNTDIDVLKAYNIEKYQYYLSICRIEPENNIHLILNTFSHTNKTLLFIGNWSRSKYGKDLLAKYQNCPNIRMIDSIYEKVKINTLRSYCKGYIHGHSAGGTNPSLVEAMFLKRPIFAFDCTYNRNTTENESLYYNDEQTLLALINSDISDHSREEKLFQIALSNYTWNKIVNDYKQLYSSR